MEIRLRNHSFMSSSSSNLWVSQKPVGRRVLCRNIGDSDTTRRLRHNSKKRCYVIFSSLENVSHSLHHHMVGLTKHTASSHKQGRMRHLLPLASAEDGVAVNGSLQVSSRSSAENTSNKINQSSEGENYSEGLVQSLHDAARVFELAIKEQCSLSRISWFSTAWLGVDRNAWVKALSYQASVYSLLQAASEISSRVDGKDKDINNFVQRSLLRQSAPLESLIRDKLLAKQPEASEWFWSEQVPAVITSFVNYFEGNPYFSTAASVFAKDISTTSGKSSEVSLLGLALTCIAAITQLGPAKVSCSQYFSMIPEITGKLMEMLADLVPLSQAYHYVKDIGLHREFLTHFGPRAAACRARNDWDSEEVVFWVNFVQKQLQQAIDREKIWSRMTTSETIEVLERDLAIFGVFIALGRSTQSFLFANGYDVIDEPMESFIRYLIGGSVLYYPQLSSISSYQLYVEVVCEELDWLPFYPGISRTPKQAHGHRSKQEGPPNAEAMPHALDVCLHWIQSFIKYSKWLENPSNVKAARFLSNGHNKLMDCMGELGISRNDIKESSATKSLDGIGFVSSSPTEKEVDSFDKALESVEGALLRLENLLQELHVSSTSSEKEHLKAACSDLERIRKLKKEAEFLEASFRAKAASLQQENDDGDPHSSEMEQLYLRGSYRKRVNETLDKKNRVGKTRGLWSFLIRPAKKTSMEPAVLDKPESDYIKQTKEKMEVEESNEIHRFEVLRNELIELEKRVQKSTNQSHNEDIILTDDTANYHDEAGGDQLVPLQKKESFIEKSVGKMKEASMDVWQGTQLLAVDVAAATGLLRRALIGDELTEKEKKAFRRTLTDLASVVPIGVLMLLPVTAVGHAAMLAAIQRYVPALIPSTYGPERLDLLRQLEKMKEMETSEANSEDDTEELA